MAWVSVQLRFNFTCMCILIIYKPEARGIRRNITPRDNISSQGVIFRRIPRAQGLSEMIYYTETNSNIYLGKTGEISTGENSTG